MPGIDRCGPRGAGPMTGGGWGVCGRPADRPGYGAGFSQGRGFGWRCGRGFGPACGAYQRPWAFGRGRSPSETDELETLRTQADALRKSLDAIHDRISELEADASEH